MKKFVFLLPLVLLLSGCFYSNVQDEGIPLPQQDTLNFTGAGITCTDGNLVTNCDVPSAGVATPQPTPTLVPTATPIPTPTPYLAYDTMQGDGVNRPQQRTLNCLARLTCVDDAGNNRTNIDVVTPTPIPPVNTATPIPPVNTATPIPPVPTATPIPTPTPYLAYDTMQGDGVNRPQQRTLNCLARLTCVDDAGNNRTNIDVVTPTPIPPVNTATPQPTPTLVPTATPQTFTQQLQLLRSNSGSSSTTTPHTIDSVAISGLNANDKLLVIVTLRQLAQVSSGDWTLSDGTNNLSTSVGIFNGTPGNTTRSKSTITLGRFQDSDIISWNASESFVNTTTTQTVRSNPQPTHVGWTTSWTLTLNSAGQTAGGSHLWTWVVYRVVGA